LLSIDLNGEQYCPQPVVFRMPEYQANKRIKTALVLGVQDAAAIAELKTVFVVQTYTVLPCLEVAAGIVTPDKRGGLSGSAQHFLNRLLAGVLRAKVGREG
jgi:hypothetical protein